MEKLHPDHIEGSEENIGQVLSAYGISDFTFSPINQGLENSSFYIVSEGKKYVLRVYRHKKKTKDEILFELRFQDYLRKEGIPIPTIYPTNEGSNVVETHIEGKEWQAILMEFIEGESTVDTYTPQLITELSRYQAKMHLLGQTFTESIDQKQLKKWSELQDSIADDVNDSSGLDEDTKGFVERVRAYRYPLNPDLPYGYNHLDLDLGSNCITKDDHVVAILDFDDLQYSPIVACLGYTLLEILFVDGESKVHEYLESYTKTRPLTDLEYEALQHVMLFRNYVIGIIELQVLRDYEHVKKALKLEKEISQMVFKHPSK